MNKILIFSYSLFLTLFVYDISLAKEYVSEKTVEDLKNFHAVIAEQGAFTIDVPDGWVVKKDEVSPGKVWFILPSGGQDKRIIERAVSVFAGRKADLKRGVSGTIIPTNVKEKDLLDYTFQNTIAFLKAAHNICTIISQKKIVLDGVPAYRIDNIMRGDGRSMYASYIGCFTKEYVYYIVIQSPDNRTAVQDKMLETIKFKH